jgi:hypothetical protein
LILVSDIIKIQIKIYKVKNLNTLDLVVNENRTVEDIKDIIYGKL